jgi:putative DNA primase/helicase
MNNETPEMAARCLAASMIAEGYEFKALHTYVTKDGAPIYWRMRARHPDGKKFIRPMHFDGSGYKLSEPNHPTKGGPLYALDRIAANPDAVVWITEGENCADALNAISLVATTSGSATSADNTDWSHLARRSCIIWPDNDNPGQKYADEVTRKLSDLDCAVEHIDVAKLNLPVKGDVIDWLLTNSTATKSDIERLPRHPPAARPESSDKAHSEFTGTPQRKTKVDLLNGASITPEPIDWVWIGWLAGGKLHILGGAAGTGKTTLALAMAAVITFGGVWPDGTQASIGDVLIWSGEDDIADSLVPRLIACGADLARCHFISGANDANGKRAFDPSKDMAALAEAMEKLPSLRLIIVDPVVSAVVGDSHKNAEVRQSLQPLVDLGAKAKCAVLGITHFSKGTQGRAPLERISGSLAFGALPRLVMGTAAPQDHLLPRRLVRLKSNIGPDGDGFEYSLARKQVSGSVGIEGQFVVWGEVLTGSSSTLIGDIEQPDKPDRQDASALEEAKRFLIKLLGNGPMAAKQLRAEARYAGLAWPTVRRAKDNLGIEAHKTGFGSSGNWFCKLPGAGLDPGDDPKVIKTSIDAHTENVSAFEGDEHLWTKEPPPEDQMEEITL